LIELLVVVAIIAILAALLLPALSSAKLRTRRIQCTSNVKQMTLSGLLYWTDYSKMLPYYPFGPNPKWRDWGDRAQHHRSPRWEAGWRRAQELARRPAPAGRSRCRVRGRARGPGTFGKAGVLLLVSRLPVSEHPSAVA
jgi:hypothetical protein